MENNQILEILKELTERIQRLEIPKNVAYRESSLEIDKLATALSKAQAHYPVIGKNRQEHFKYSDKDFVKKAVDALLEKNGLSVIAGIRVVDGQERFFMKLLHESGQFQISECIFEVEYSGKRSRMQERGAAITYLSRYLYQQILGVTIDNDPLDNDDSENSPLNNHKDHEYLTEEEIEEFRGLPSNVQQSIMKFNKINKLSDLTQKQFMAFKKNYYKKKD